MELAVFLDPAAYAGLSPVLSGGHVSDITFSLINQVQALYRLPSLGPLPIHFSISSLEIQLRAPVSLQNYAGQQYQMLDSFCQYQFFLNGQHGRRWDLAVYLTGLDLWAQQGSFNTLGLAHTGGICQPRYSCLVTEFATQYYFTVEKYRLFFHCEFF